MTRVNLTTSLIRKRARMLKTTDDTVIRLNSLFEGLLNRICAPLELFKGDVGNESGSG